MASALVLGNASAQAPAELEAPAADAALGEAPVDAGLVNPADPAEPPPLEATESAPEPAPSAAPSATTEPDPVPEEIPDEAAFGEEADRDAGSGMGEEAADEMDAEEDAASADEPAPEPIDWQGLVDRFPEFFAVTHHASVHLPIALWLFGAFFVVVGLVVPSWRNQVPLACLIGGMITSIPAVASGWWYAEFEWGNDWREWDWSEHIVKHRWGAVALLSTSAVLSIMAIVNQWKQSRTVGFVWRFGLIGLALGVAWVGHVGGELIQGEGFFEEALEAWLESD